MKNLLLISVICGLLLTSSCKKHDIIKPITQSQLPSGGPDMPPADEDAK